MNLLANKSIDLPHSFLALDCGSNNMRETIDETMVSTKVSVVAIIINL